MSRSEFKVHRLNGAGLANAELLANSFSYALGQIEAIVAGLTDAKESAAG